MKITRLSCALSLGLLTAAPAVAAADTPIAELLRSTPGIAAFAPSRPDERPVGIADLVRLKATAGLRFEGRSTALVPSVAERWAGSGAPDAERWMRFEAAARRATPLAPPSAPARSGPYHKN